jgi:hypothetical protein
MIIVLICCGNPWLILRGGVWLRLITPAPTVAGPAILASLPVEAAIAVRPASHIRQKRMAMAGCAGGVAFAGLVSMGLDCQATIGDVL